MRSELQPDLHADWGQQQPSRAAHRAVSNQANSNKAGMWSSSESICLQVCKRVGKVTAAGRSQQNLVCGVAVKTPTHLHRAGRSAKAPATGQPKQQAPAATGSAAVGQRLPSTQPDIAAGAPAPAQQRRLQGPQHAPTASGKGQQQAPRTNGSAAGAPPAPPTAPQLFLPQPAQRTAPQQQVGPAHTGPAHTGRPATPPPKKPAPGAASTPTGRTATPPLKKPAPAPEPDYAAAFESAAKAIPLAGKPRRRRTSGSLVGGAGEASHARAASKSKKAAIARKDAVSPQVLHMCRVAVV